MSRKSLLAAAVPLLLLSGFADAFEPTATPEFSKRRALVKSAYQPSSERTPSAASASAAALPAVGLLGKEQFRMFNSAWNRFHYSVATGNIDALRAVVRNGRSCRNALAVRAEQLMESRATMWSPAGEAEKTMGEWILAFGQKIAADQLGASEAPFLVAAGPTTRVRFGNVTFVEGEYGFWNVDLGC